MMQIPPLKACGVEIAELEVRREELLQNRRALRLAQSQLPGLVQGVEHARLEDTRAGVKARREGSKDPGPKKEMSAQAALDRLRREVAVLEGLDLELEDEAVEILRQHAEEITQALEAHLAQANDTQLAAIGTLQEARSQRLRLTTTLGQVSEVLPQPEAVAAEAGDYVEVLAHHAADSIFRVDEDQVQKVIAFLKGEAGDTAERDELVAQENPPTDVVDLGTSLAVAPGRVAFEQRRAERRAEWQRPLSPGT